MGCASSLATEANGIASPTVVPATVQDAENDGSRMPQPQAAIISTQGALPEGFALATDANGIATPDVVSATVQDAGNDGSRMLQPQVAKVATHTCLPEGIVEGLQSLAEVGRT